MSQYKRIKRIKCFAGGSILSICFFFRAHYELLRCEFYGDLIVIYLAGIFLAIRHAFDGFNANTFSKFFFIYILLLNIFTSDLWINMSLIIFNILFFCWRKFFFLHFINYWLLYINKFESQIDQWFIWSFLDGECRKKWDNVDS